MSPINIILALSILAGCPTGHGLDARILWPPPPEKPVLEFIGAYYSQDNFPKTAGQRFLRDIIGSPSSRFNRPFGIASDRKGKVYISDSQDRIVKVFDFNKKEVGYFIKEPVFDMPLGLALDDSENLYVADGKKGKVMVFSPGGELIASFGAKDIFIRPSYIAINSRMGRIYVSDGRMHRIAVFNMRGSLLFFIGGPGGGNGRFAVPQGIAIDRDGRLFIADMLNARVQVFDADGNFLYAFGRQGRGYMYFENPRDLAFTGDGNLYIIDQRKGLLYTYTPEGRLLLITGGTKRTSHRLGFSTPTAISIDPSGRIYITDPLNRRFVAWQHISEDYIRKHPIPGDNMDGDKKVVNPGNAISHRTQRKAWY